MCAKSAWILLSSRWRTVWTPKKSETVCLLFTGRLTEQPATVTSNWFIPDTCCLPSCCHSALLCWQSAPSMFTPVGMGFSGGCLWLHYAVKMKWGSGGDLIRSGWLDKWEGCPLLCFCLWLLDGAHFSFFTLFFYSTGYFLCFFISSLASLNLILENG